MSAIAVALFDPIFFTNYFNSTILTDANDASKSIICKDSAAVATVTLCCYHFYSNLKFSMITKNYLISYFYCGWPSENSAAHSNST